MDIKRSHGAKEASGMGDDSTSKVHKIGSGIAKGGKIALITLASVVFAAGAGFTTYYAVNKFAKNPYEVSQDAVQGDVNTDIKGGDPTDDIGGDLIAPSDGEGGSLDEILDQNVDPTKPIPPEGQEEPEIPDEDDEIDDNVSENEGSQNQNPDGSGKPNWHDPDRIF